jgi:hypothetical protein
MESLLRAADHSILPCELGDRLFGAARRQPEKRLQLAVLQDAIRTFHRSVGGARNLFAEVDAWFASDDSSGAFTFVTICDTLDFDPAYIRRGLERWRARAETAATRRLLVGREAIGTRHQVVPPSLRRSA